MFQITGRHDVDTLTNIASRTVGGDEVQQLELLVGDTPLGSGNKMPVDTELPAAAALSDSLANPTTTSVGAFLLGWTTSAWERVRSVGGALMVSLRDGAGAAFGTSGNPIRTDPTGTTTQPTKQVPGTTLLDGTKTVASTATPEALAGSTAVRWVSVQALSTNTQSVKVGNATSQSLELWPGDVREYAIDNLNKLFVDVAVNGEGVAYQALQ